MSIYQSLIIWLHNKTCEPGQEYVVRKPIAYKYTFHLVGLDKHAWVITNKGRDDATRMLYDNLPAYDLERMEWADLESTEAIYDEE